MVRFDAVRSSVQVFQEQGKQRGGIFFPGQFASCRDGGPFGRRLMQQKLQTGRVLFQKNLRQSIGRVRFEILAVQGLAAF